MPGGQSLVRKRRLGSIAQRLPLLPRDVLERNFDDRTFEQRSADATRARAAQVPAPVVCARFTFGAQARASAG
jgi:hypothetical protein